MAASPTVRLLRPPLTPPPRPEVQYQAINDPKTQAGRSPLLGTLADHGAIMRVDRMATGRNESCPCGSGRKYKKCCARLEHSILTPAALILGLLIRIGVTVTITAMINAPEPEAAPGKVWSAEHGHWHDVPSGGARGPNSTPAPQPPGPAPPGKVWSPEHGHWHDAP